MELRKKGDLNKKKFHTLHAISWHAQSINNMKIKKNYFPFFAQKKIQIICHFKIYKVFNLKVLQNGLEIIWLPG